MEDFMKYFRDYKERGMGKCEICGLYCSELPPEGGICYECEQKLMEEGDERQGIYQGGRRDGADFKDGKRKAEGSVAKEGS